MELHKVSVKCALLAETGNRCRSRDAGNRRSNQSRRSLPESTVKASGFETRLCGSDRERTAPQKRMAKIRKIAPFASGYESIGKVPACPAGKRELWFNFKMKKMEKINKYKNCRIENLQDYYGGNYSIHTGEQNTASQDREVYNDDNCLIKRINGAGFSNWIHGNRSVETFDGNCSGYTYSANVNMQID